MAWQEGGCVFVCAYVETIMSARLCEERGARSVHMWWKVMLSSPGRGGGGV